METENKLRCRHQTDFICIDSRKCAACWKCIGACPKDVLGKIDFIVHRHVRIRNGQACIGCKRCVRICPHQAITGIGNTKSI